MEEVKRVNFINPYYKPEWLEFVPSAMDDPEPARYCDGHYKLKDGVKRVYDGSCAIMGKILPDGTIVSNDTEGAPPSEYEMTFLRAAAEHQEE